MGRKKNQVAPVAKADREFVLGAAAHLFRQQGFDKTTVKEIAEACGMLPGSLHYRYASKESILVDLMRLALEQASGSLSDAIKEEADPLEQLRKGVNAHLELLVGGSDIVYVLLFEWRSLHGSARQEMISLRDSYELIWAAMLESLSAQELIRSDVDRGLLRLIGLGALNWVATWFNEGGRYTVKDIGDFVWMVIKEGVLKR